MFIMRNKLKTDLNIQSKTNNYSCDLPAHNLVSIRALITVTMNVSIFMSSSLTLLFA